ncbi:MAG: hypothetical protein R2861_13275 [Desulfobacterales bacterium]
MGVSIRASEVITLLAGGVPVYEYDSVSMETSESSGQETLVFRKRWLGVVEKIFFRERPLKKVEVFRWGNTIYQATLNDVRPVDGRSAVFSGHRKSGWPGFQFFCGPAMDRCGSYVCHV